MKKIFLFIYISVGLFIFGSLPAQITVDLSYTSTELIEDVLLEENCNQVTNVSYVGNANSVGYYSSGNADIFMDGVFLTTGDANEMAQASSVLVSADMGTPGDATLDIIASSAVSSDAAVLEFDFTPSADKISLNYVFASEEYPDYICNTAFNDAMGIVIAGPGITGQNIAVVPGTTQNIGVQSVNTGIVGANGTLADCISTSNGNLLIDNSGSTQLVYNAYTIPLTAELDITPCETYRIKMGIEDVGDSEFDSALFVERGSFVTSGSNAGTSTTITMSSESPGGIAAATFNEDCNSFNLIIDRLDSTSAYPAESYNITYAGTATNGTDYTPPTTVNFAAGETTTTLNIPLTVDGLNEPLETIIIDVILPACNCAGSGTNTYTVEIVDAIAGGCVAVDSDLKVLLEGAYVSSIGIMQTASIYKAALPANQPYNAAPWNYTGTETLDVANLPSGFIDWVIVEVWDDAYAGVVETKAAYLLEDGSVVNASANNSTLSFFNLMLNESYHFIVRHRSHLAVASTTPSTVSASSTIAYDFTTADTQEIVGNLKMAPDGKYTLLAGDFDQNGAITSLDIDVYIQDTAQGNSDPYTTSNCNLSSSIDLVDFNLFLTNNSAIGVNMVRL